MKTSITGFMRNMMRPGTSEMVAEFLGHLKELRDAPSRHQEFFDLYIFSDDTEYRKKLIAPPKATEQGSLPDPTALESIFVAVKKNCHICDFANVDSPVGPCLKCAQDTMSGFKLSSTLTER